MSKKETDTERLRRITNTPTLVSAIPASQQQQQQQQQQYLPASELWRSTVEYMTSRSLITRLQADTWLRPCKLLVTELPSGKMLAARISTVTTYAADYIHMRFHASIRATLNRLTGKQIHLIIRGPDRPNPTFPPLGKPTGNDAA